jgi:hypothetical protein
MYHNPALVHMHHRSHYFILHNTVVVVAEAVMITESAVAVLFVMAILVKMLKTVDLVH